MLKCQKYSRANIRVSTNKISYLQGISMIRIKLILFIMTMAVPTIAFSADICQEATKQFNEATAVYKKHGSAKFMNRVLKDGPLEEDKRSLAQVQALSQIEQFFGDFQSSSIISTKQLGKKACFLIGVLEFKNGPAFAVATYYQAEKGVTATAMTFRTEPEAVFPSKLLIQ